MAVSTKTTSYASKAAVAANNTNDATTTMIMMNGDNNVNIQQRKHRLQQLKYPPPVSMPLISVLKLLEQPQEGNSVYLMDRDYIQNWIIWCYHQNVINDNEMKRLHEATRLAAVQLYLSVLPSENDIPNSYHDPGPIDNSKLGVEGHPLLLSSWVRIASTSATTTANTTNATTNAINLTNGKNTATILPKRTKSLTNERALLQLQQQEKEIERNNNNNAKNSITETVAESKIIYCIPVPESFYELLRSTHGVLCEDLETVSFQLDSEQERLLLLHHTHNPNKQNQYTKDDNHNHYNYHNNHHHDYDDEELLAPSPRPIEFRRKMIRIPYNSNKDNNNGKSSSVDNNNASLMEKLLLEETQQETRLAVEVHPIKMFYTLDDDDDNNNSNSNNFVLVSRETAAIDAVLAILRVAAPNKATTTIRLWSLRQYNSNNNNSNNNNNKNKNSNGSSDDKYELVDLTQLQESPYINVGNWVESHLNVNHNNKSQPNEFKLLIESRRTVNASWPRAHLELSNRIQPGDYVDAQDVAGKWYEAVVREVHDDYVVVHYAGWASRWDSKMRRYNPDSSNDNNDDEDDNDQEAKKLPHGVPTKIKAPAPLWSRSGRWRQALKIDDEIEVRDTSSIAERPKWYKGKVKKIGNPNDPPNELKGGASLEKYLAVDGTSQPLLILGRTQQILVEVEQEKTIGTSSKSIIQESDDDSVDDETTSIKPNPPSLRWVNLYGEEICKLGTHLKETKDLGPVTLRYEVDGSRKPVEVMKSHPMHGSGFMRESLRGTPPAPGSVGLHNLGNSCFLNSIVQCLNHIEPLTQYFLQDKYSKDLNKRNPLGSGGNVAVAYASLLKKMWAGNHSVLVPRLLKQTVASFAPQFDNSYQHDSHEFCQFLMDGLHEDLNRVKKKPYVEELDGFGMPDDVAAIESWRKHLLRHDSVVVDHCQGMHRSHLTCPQCGRESIKFDVYSSISLPLPMDKNQNIIKLEDCVEKFMEAEQLDERDAYYCSNCRRHVCALKLIALWTVPDILIIHLKRFTFDTCMLSGGMLRSKVDNTVEFPINGLDLTKQVLGPIDPQAPPIYNLFGVSEHSGPTANSGHYTATIRNSIDGQWYRCNDSHVGLTSGEAAITGGAYLLFYQRAKGICKWGGMYNIMKQRNIDPYCGSMEDIEGFKQVKNKKNNKKK